MTRLIALLAVVVQLSLVGAAAAAEKTKVVWAYVNPSSYYWDVYAAIDLGFMADENLDVDPINAPSAGQGAQLLLSSSVNILSTNIEVAIAAIDQGADIRLVGGELARATFALTIRPEIDGYPGLKGKTLGVTQLTDASTTMLKLLLKKNGIGAGDYDLVTVGGTPSRFAALKTGAIAATMLSQPADFQAQALGMRVLNYAYEAFDGPVVAFAAQRDWAGKNTDTLVRFLRATAKAARWLDDPANREPASQILLHHAQLDPDDARKNYDLWYGPNQMMAKDLALPASGVRAYLDLRGSKDKPEKYMDMSYAAKAMGR